MLGLKVYPSKQNGPQVCFTNLNGWSFTSNILQLRKIGMLPRDHYWAYYSVIMSFNSNHFDLLDDGSVSRDAMKGGLGYPYNGICYKKTYPIEYVAWKGFCFIK